MTTLDREEGPDEPSASKSIEGESRGKLIEEKLSSDPASTSKRNEITPNGSKRKRKDWRAFASENGGDRRRFLRSDMAKLLAETEARAAKGAGTRFNPAELEGVDWVKCGNDLQISNGNVGQLNEMVNKKSNVCDVGLVNGKEVTDIGKTEHLGNAELGTGERKEGDDVASGIAESDLSSEKKVEQLVTKEREEVNLLDVNQLEGTDEGGNEVVLERKGKGATEDQVADYASCENSKGGIEIKNSKVKEEPTEVQKKETAEAEEIKTEDKQFTVLKKAKKKLSAANKRTLVKVESVNVERRITRSSAAKQKVNDEIAAEPEVATAVQCQMEEESSGLDQTDADDNELLKSIKLKTNKKMRSDRRKSSDLTDSDEDFSPKRKRVRKKQAKVEADRDGSVSLGTKWEPSMKRNKLKMDKQDSEEDVKVIKGRNRQNKHSVESEDSDCLGYQKERLSKKKEPEMESEDSSSN